MAERKKSLIAGKKILFFSPAFFGYEEKIAEKMRKLGARVDAFDVRSVTGAMERAVLKISPGLFYKKTEAYYAHIFSQVRHIDYDYVLFIKCDMPTERVLRIYRERFQKAKFCLHMWDSVKNIPGVKKKFKYFDFISSFDRMDCAKNLNIHFRPLYYCDEYKRKPAEDSFYDYDLCFIGTIHSDRWRILKELSQQAERMGLRVFIYPYLQSRFIYWLYRLVKPEFWGTNISDFRFDKISSEDAAGKIERARAVIDIQHPDQTGLTIRTIEVIGMNKKLVTTNTDIRNYDFYNKKNILVIDRKNPKLNVDFGMKFEPPGMEIYEKYSLEAWIYGVLGMRQV